MKQLEVQILRQSFRLSCPEGEEGRLRAAVEKVDTAMGRILEAGKVRSRERIAVLAAINLAFDGLEATAPQPLPQATLPEEISAAHWQGLLARLDEALAEPDVQKATDAAD